jgi:diadenosine tetraphosphate (Ap4A) HIT family hydrolase
MKLPKTRWATVTLFARIFTGLYILAIIVTQPHWGPNWGWDWPGWVRDITGAILAVAIMILTIWYGGILTNFYDLLTGFGISAVRVDRHGADPMQTKVWMDRIEGSEEVVIVGTLSQGWFVVAQENLKTYLSKSKQPKCIRVCLLDPFGKVWRSKVDSGQPIHDRFLREATQVFRNLSDLMTSHPDRIVVRLYDTDPLSCVVARGAIYLGLYLPRTERKEIPEFTISRGSFLGDKVYAESLNKLQRSAPEVKGEGLKQYIITMERHFTASREAFWSDPAVFCDFCKERQSLPSEFSRRYPDLSRIIPAKKSFFMVPSLGQIVKDHALIVSNAHVTSSAQLEADARRELAEIFEILEARADKENKTQLFFEHGVPYEGTVHGGCGICHCHIHALPVESTKDNLADMLYIRA